MAGFDVLYTLATGALNSVLAALAAAGVETPGHVHVSATEPPLDACCDGFLAAWPSRLFMADPFPIEAEFAPGGCDVAVRAMDLSVRYAMCIPTPKSHAGGPILPTPEELGTAGLEGAKAMLALHRGLACWAGDVDGFVGETVADDLEGGECASWTGIVTVEVEDCGCPTGALGP